jgi:hypothetical protein
MLNPFRRPDSTLDRNRQKRSESLFGFRYSAQRGLVMGILDSLENSPAFKGVLGQLGATVLPAVLSEVMGNGGQGGLNAVVAKLQQAGLGDQVKSWLGNGRTSRSPRNSFSRFWAATRSSSSLPNTTFPSTRSARSWRSNCRRRSITRARTGSCRTRPDLRKKSSLTAGNATPGGIICLFEPLVPKRARHLSGPLAQDGKCACAVRLST